VRGIPLGVALVAAGLYLVRLSAAPFLDPPEGFHVVIARGMLATGDWLTPHLNGVRYFDKPPMFHWLMATAFGGLGLTPFLARMWSALAAVACAAVTARLGVLLGGPRVGLLAGLMVVTNLGMYLYGRMVKPDLVFILCIVLALAGFALAFRGGGRWTMVLFYAALGMATVTKDMLGAAGPLAVTALFLWLTGERKLQPWLPWWSVLVLGAIALPWYVLAEARNPGFLWYTLIDNHVLNLARQRIFPDEDVPLDALSFLLVTAAAFLPWTPAAAWGAWSVLRAPRASGDRLWLLFVLWAGAVIAFFTLSPFKLPHHGLPAFPALALLAARAWDAAIAGGPAAPTPRMVLVPVLVVFVAVALAFAAAWAGVLPIPDAAMTSVDLATRNLAARGQSAPEGPHESWAPILATCSVVFIGGVVAVAVAVARRSPALGVAVTLATVLAFLPAAGQGMAQFAQIRSVRPVAAALAARLRPGDLVIHEGALENSASLLLTLSEPVRVVNGLQSNLAFGSTFPEARDVFWDIMRLREEWTGPARRFLVSGVMPTRSAVRALPPDRVHLLVEGGGRRLYVNRLE
jgi:4-amino-4-deoxy-L-arabinose transferase-like glycosyltransferase